MDGKFAPKRGTRCWLFEALERLTKLLARFFQRKGAGRPVTCLLGELRRALVLLSQPVVVRERLAMFVEHGGF